MKSDDVDRRSDQDKLNLHHVPVRFVKSAVLSIPVHATIAAVILFTISLVVFRGEPENNWWHSVTRWSITATAVMIGLVCGGLLGFLSSAKKAVGQFHEQLAAWFHHVPPRSPGTDQAARSIQEARAQYEFLLESAVSAGIGRIPLPKFLDRLVRSKLRQAVVDDFIDSLGQRGVVQVSPQDFRNWVMTKGLALGFEPIYNQLAFWRYLITGLLGLLLAGLIGTAYLSR